MVHGIGLDVLDISRLDGLRDAPDDPFYKKAYTDKELEAGKKHKNPIRYFAERFAAKEAVFKALCITPDELRLKDIETLNDETGRPYVTLYGRAREAADSAGITCIHISLSGDGGFAAAVAVCEV